MDARLIVIAVLQKFGDKSVYIGAPLPHSSNIQKPRAIRVKNPKEPEGNSRAQHYNLVYNL